MKLPTREEEANKPRVKAAMLQVLASNPVLRASYYLNRTMGSNEFASAIASIRSAGLAPEHMPLGGAHDLGAASKRAKIEELGNDIKGVLENWLQMEVRRAMEALH